MSTVFSHIIQKRLSQEYENVATEALAFIVRSSESARIGLAKFLRGIEPGLPGLSFRTQETDGSTRPDMCGFDGTKVRVFIENKFWAGLTEQQPVEYVERLSKGPQPAVLLMVVPAAREETVWREVCRRCKERKVGFASEIAVAGGVRSVKTHRGPFLALTSWGRLLSAVEAEVKDEPDAKSDLVQLRSLCDAADNEAFIPITSEEVTDQRLPSFILQLNTIVQGAVDVAVSKGVVSIRKLLPQASWERVGRYMRFSGASDIGAWLGTGFALWKAHGTTPLWLIFEGEWGRAVESRGVLEPWASRKGVVTAWEDDKFAVGIELATGQEREAVIAGVADQLREISEVLAGVKQPRQVRA